MVEGIFDFGKAGLRKGLRLTGIQDNIENAKASLSVGGTKNPLKKKIGKTSKVGSPEKLIVAEECVDTVWMNPLTMDSPNFDGQILLVCKNSILNISNCDKNKRKNADRGFRSVLNNQESKWYLFYHFIRLIFVLKIF